MSFQLLGIALYNRTGERRVISLKAGSVTSSPVGEELRQPPWRGTQTATFPGEAEELKRNSDSHQQFPVPEPESILFGLF